MNVIFYLVDNIFIFETDANDGHTRHSGNQHKYLNVIPIDSGLQVLGHHICNETNQTGQCHLVHLHGS